MNKLLFTCLAALGVFASRAQSLDSTLASYADHYQPEKTYLHYDKDSYYPGETIWFKAYLMEEILPAIESRTFYVDWIGEKGEVLSHTVSPLVDGFTNGQFEIPEEYTSGSIHVRAYTKWMLNFDTAFIYNKDIRILSKNAASVKTPRAAAVTDFRFFPEGGDLILGINNRVAFLAADQWGRPVNVKGALLDSKGAFIDSFKSVHDGMGYFYFTPKEGSGYTAKWKDDKGLVHTSNLPEIKPTGIGIQLQPNGDRRILTLSAGNNLPANLKMLHMVGTINQRMVYKTDIPMTDVSARRVLPTGSLPSGILVITIFDAGWNAIGERISFVNNHDFSFTPSFDVEHWGMGKRKRNEIKISIPDSLQGANLSISVTDAAIETDTSDNIISQLMLSSEIKGKIYNPAYYFSNDNDSVVQNLDLVMLTHGWRRFKWEEVVKGKLPQITYPKDTTYLSLSGKVFGVSKSQLSGKDNIVLLVKEKDSATKMLIYPISTNGSFGDPEVILLDTLQVYYSLKSKFLAQAEARFMVDRLPAPNYIPFARNFLPGNPNLDTVGNYRHQLLAAKANELLDLQKGKVMEMVTVTAKQKTPVQKLEERYPTGMFKGGDGIQFDLINDPFARSATDILTFLQGKVAGLQINANANPPSLSWRGGTPQIYLDEIPTDAEMITSIPVSDIAYVKVFRPPFMGSSGGGSGGIAIYTKKGGDDTPGTGHGLSSNKIAGYTPIRQFYSPNYDTFDPRNDHVDIRTTLYWNPSVMVSGNKHSVVLSFYNNDVARSFRVVIEGMSKDGLLTHFEQVME